MKNNFLLLTLFFALIFTAGCRKDAILTDTYVIPALPVVYDIVTSEIYGRVSDRNGNFIQNAAVKWGDAETLTDENGFFRLNGAAREHNAVLTVTRPGFYKAVQTLQTVENERVKTSVQMTPRSLSGTLQATDGGIVTANDNATIDFAAAGFVDAAGNAYSGEVHVFAHYLDPTIDDLEQIMPGNLTAIDATNRPQLLTSYGMINVELEDPAGNPLQISAPATLTVPAASHSDNRPDDLPLWYFDAENGTWREEGNATLQGDFYVGEVEHFTWWNCDVPSDFILMEGQFDGGETGVPTLKVKITRISDGSIGIASTYDSGVFSFFVPKNEDLLFEVFETCGNLIYTQEIETLGEDTDLGLISVSGFLESMFHFTGKIVDCESQPVTTGYLLLSSGEQIEVLLPDAAGNVNRTLSYCPGDEIIYYAVDTETNLGSDYLAAEYAPTIDIGTVAACAEVVENGLTINFGNEVVTISPCTVSGNIPNIGLGNNLLFLAVDNQLAGEIIYGLSYHPLDNDGDGQADTYYVPFAETTGNPSPVYQIGFVPNLAVISNGQEPGEILHVSASEVRVKEMTTGTIYENCTIDIRAIIQ